MASKAVNDPSKPVNDLVPIGDRLRWTLLCRAVLAPITLVLVIFVSPSGTVRLAVLWAAWIAVTLLLFSVARRSRRSAVAVLNVSLLGDGAVLATAWNMLGGLDGPGTFLLILHVIGVTLLASFRTGAKISMWHAVLMVSVVQSQLKPDEALPTLQLSLHLAQLGATALLTASFAAVNERELRRRRYDDQVLRDAATAFIDDTDPMLIAERLTELARKELLARRAVVMVQIDDADALSTQGWAVVATDAVSRRTLTGAITQNALVDRALLSGSVSLVRSVDAATDPDLAELLPNARNLICLPFTADQIRGVLVLEHDRNSSQRSMGRVERRMLATAEHATYLATMSLSRAVLLDRLKAAAQTDALTHVANRRTFDATLTAFLREAAVSGSSTSVALLDLDHFKRINDEHGHLTGDDVLRRTGAALQGIARAGDIVARYGGEEFAVIMAATSGEEAMRVGETIRVAIEGMASPVTVTASVGVACFAAGAGTVEALVAEADRALYKAKASGRNRVVAAHDEPKVDDGLDGADWASRVDQLTRENPDWFAHKG